ncbi:MAG: hypothetical protein OEZ29_00360 [Candidatus Bathyarchaeota archaeon]|nr:hypothetical protein [Candidatus Bathyarchaeota archaeon]MDH5779030.1 hypothetical protein [Candidatus Bathyarchaeota archaeon]
MPRKSERKNWGATRRGKNIKKLLEIIRENPGITVSEIVPDDHSSERKFGVTSRSIHNWLELLETLGLVYKEGYKRKGYEWYPSESKRPTFGTKEYELAVEHARLLVHGRSEQGLPGVATYPIHTLLQLLVTRSDDHKEFLNHLKTGPSYHELYAKLEDYRKVLKKRGKLIKQRYSDGLGADPPDADDVEINFTIPTSKWIAEGMGDHLQPQMTSKNLEEIDGERVALFKEIAGELADIFRQVDTGPNPLDGYCDSCPHLRATIKNSGKGNLWCLDHKSLNLHQPISMPGSQQVSEMG